MAFVISCPLVRTNLTRSSTACRHVRLRTPGMSLAPPDVHTMQWLATNPAALQKVADAFQTLNLPKWAVDYGHPALMGTMILGMGLPGAAFGWLGRTNENKRAGVKQKQTHEGIMLAFFLLAFLGGTGGLLSTAMQGHDIGESKHFISAGIVLALLLGNAIIAYSGFTIGNDGSAKGRLQGRTVHAYLGAATMTAILVHAGLGLKILME